MCCWSVRSSSFVGEEDHVSRGGAVATGDEPRCDILDVVDAAVELVGRIEVVDTYEEGFSADGHCHCHGDAGVGVGDGVLAIADSVLIRSMTWEYMVFMI